MRGSRSSPSLCPIAARDRLALVMAPLACAAALFVTTARVEARALIETVAIRVYDLAGLDRGRHADVMRTAEAILGDVGLNAEWRDCARAAPSALSCAGPRGRHDLVIRIMQGGGRTGDGPLSTLGYSVIETTSGAGALATIFMDRVERMARHAGADPDELAGRAIAHEIGHLLLGTNQHSGSGLMREVWTPEELFRNRPEDWRFAGRERGQLRSAWLRAADTARTGMGQ